MNSILDVTSARIWFGIFRTAFFRGRTVVGNLVFIGITSDDEELLWRREFNIDVPLHILDFYKMPRPEDENNPKYRLDRQVSYVVFKRIDGEQIKDEDIEKSIAIITTTINFEYHLFLTKRQAYVNLSGLLSVSCIDSYKYHLYFFGNTPSNRTNEMRILEQKCVANVHTAGTIGRGN